MKRLLYLLAIAVIAVYLIYGLITMFSNIENYTTSDFFVLSIILVIVISTEIFLVKKYRNMFSVEAVAMRKETIEAKEKERFDIDSKIPGSKARQQLLGADISVKVKHMAGLPIAEGAEVFIYRCPKKVIFERNQSTYELPLERISDILNKTDVEIQKSYSSSVGGAVGGYVLFGPLGAMIGGRSKEKKSTVIEKYLIFSYVNQEGKPDYISFEVTNEPKAWMFNDGYYDLTKEEHTTIEL